MKRITLIVPVLLVVLLLAAGCTNQPPAAQPTPVPATPAPVTTAAPAAPAIPADLAGNWILTSLGIQGGTAVTYPTTEISLTINPDGSMTGYDGCNNYFGTVTLPGTTTPKGSGMKISDIGSTKKYCANLASQEQQYLNILGKTAAYDIDGTSGLVLTGDMGDVLMYKRPAAVVTPTVVREY